jgi:hypothetical protein
MPPMQSRIRCPASDPSMIDLEPIVEVLVIVVEARRRSVSAWTEQRRAIMVLYGTSLTAVGCLLNFKFLVSKWKVALFIQLIEKQQIIYLVAALQMRLQGRKLSHTLKIPIFIPYFSLHFHDKFVMISPILQVFFSQKLQFIVERNSAPTNCSMGG